MNALTETSLTSLRRAGYFTVLLLIVTVVADGQIERQSELLHQFVLLPATLLFVWALYRLLFVSGSASPFGWTPRRSLALALLFELGFVGLYSYECRHFAAFGYRLDRPVALVILAGSLVLLTYALRSRASAAFIFIAAVVSAAASLVLSILSFPLNYLRSDMLPVIFWADRSLLLGTDPYATIHAVDRLYDFPYLPGMMLTYLPFAAMDVDLRYGSIAYLVGLAGLVLWAARKEYRVAVAALLALFLLCPFLQYRHDLYLEPHWFTLVLIFVLMQRRRFAWAAVAFGVSMAIYQFSWILFPFFLLNALRRRGWGEVAKMVLLGALGALAVAGPFLRSASHRIAHNTVGQWGVLLKHAVAEPMNLSFWATYVVRPDHLLRLQAVLMVGIFGYCFVKGRCADLADTLRWMIVALTTFVLFNVLVDGYFFLMLLVPMLIFTCVANGWWAEPDGPTHLPVVGTR